MISIVKMASTLMLKEILIIMLKLFLTMIKVLKVVVLPAPLTPSKAKHSPWSRPNDTLSTAVRLVVGPVLNTF